MKLIHVVIQGDPIQTFVHRYFKCSSVLNLKGRFILSGMVSEFWCRIHLWFRLMGGQQAKSMTSQRNRAVQDGGYALPWQRYDNNKMVAMRYYGNVMTTTMSQYSDDVSSVAQSTFAVEDVYTELVIDVFYIFNSTVIDWPCYIFFYTSISGMHNQSCMGSSSRRCTHT